MSQGEKAEEKAQEGDSWHEWSSSLVGQWRRLGWSDPRVSWPFGLGPLLFLVEVERLQRLDLLQDATVLAEPSGEF